MGSPTLVYEEHVDDERVLYAEADAVCRSGKLAQLTGFHLDHPQWLGPVRRDAAAPPCHVGVGRFAGDGGSPEGLEQAIDDGRIGVVPLKAILKSWLLHESRTKRRNSHRC